MSDDLNLSMFRAYDIRTGADALTPELSERLARAEARYFRETLGVSGVIVAHDARRSGPRYLTAATQIYQDFGLDVVWAPGVSSTSLFYFTAMQLPDHAAVMFGASHNPAGDTGRKIVGPGVRPIAEHIGPAGGLDQIKAFYLEDKPLAPAARGQLRATNNLHEYIEYSMKLAGVAPGGLTGVSVFHDYLFGAGGREMTVAFGLAGANLLPLHFTADGDFPLGDPNPVKPPVIREGLAAMQTFVPLLGCFFDGDADRIDVYAGDGRYLSSSFVYAGILPYIRLRCTQPRVGVFADLKCNPLAVIEMARAGVNVSVMRNGHSQIKEAMFSDPAVIGAVEESAHFYEAFRLDSDGPFCTENTLYIALLVCRAWHENPERLEELFRIQAETSREREWGHYFPDDGRREAALQAVETFFKGEGAASIDRTDGGMDLEGTLIRRGLPFTIDSQTRLAPDWLQVCQRVSQSENGLARWEVVAATPQITSGARDQIERLVQEFGASEPYRG
ncbi:MAG: phosphoglucomutase [Armatimonadota bacterium]|nr:phosphoglucomutase [Armatimonadota bacterium]